MGFFGSKTKYYVSSSTVPMFDRKDRVNNFKAGMLDFTANSPIEFSEYSKNLFSGLKVRHLRSFVRWAGRNGYDQALGKINATFYGDASFDNVAVANAIRNQIALHPNDKLAVQEASLNFFSEDFWIRHLATQQGKANWFENPGDLYYTLEYPTESSIKVVFNDGKVLTGSLPSLKDNSRFLEISYSIVRGETITTPNPDPSIPPTTSTTYKSLFGYLHYQEGTGNTALDSLIKNNGTKPRNSFFPVIPLRTNTSWLGGHQANKVNEAIAFLELYNRRNGPQTSYEQLKKNLTEGMKDGNMGDIDYITLFLGVPINSKHNSDQRYIFQFFYNLYANQALAEGKKPQSFIGGKPIYNKLGNFGKFGFFTRKALRRFKRNCPKFQLYNPTSNFNYTYAWLTADYFENTGTWKPGAKPGEFGTLAGYYDYEWTYWVTETDSEGNEYEVLKKGQASYNLTLFCWQFNKNRWKFLAFVDLDLTNLVYAGKTIRTDTYEAVKEAEETTEIAHDFTADDDGTYESWGIRTFKYVSVTGESDSAFIVPLEESTFREIGAKEQVEISHSCYYLVFNCWVKKKKKWYQSGFIGAIIGAIGIVISIYFPPAGALAALALQVGSWTLFVVSVIQLAGDAVLKILTTILGDSLGTAVYKNINNIIKIYASIVAVFGGPMGWFIGAVIMFATTFAQTLYAGGSFGTALKNGLIAGVMTGVAGKVAPMVGDWLNGFSAATNTGIATGAAGATEVVGSTATTWSPLATAGAAGTSSFITGFGVSALQGNSLAEAFKTGLIAGATSFIISYGVDFLAEFANTSALFQDLSAKFHEATNGFFKAESSSAGSITNANKGNASGSVTKPAKPTEFDFGFTVDKTIEAVVNNPMTYINLINMTQEEAFYHKMANLENDYVEFNDKLQTVNKVLNQLEQMTNTMVDSQFLLKLQLSLGRFSTMFGEVAGSMTSDDIITLGTASATDHIKGVLGSISNFSETKLTMVGYDPEQLFFTQADYTVNWDQF